MSARRRRHDGLVIDASVAAKACLGASGFEVLAGNVRLVAPYLLWSETTAALRELTVRHEIDAAAAQAGLERLLGSAIEPVWRPDLYPTASLIATRLGRAKTYDAEYVALAQLLDMPLVTVDARLARGAAAHAQIVGPTQLWRGTRISATDPAPPVRGTAGSPSRCG